MTSSHILQYATVAQSTNEMYQTQLRELKLNMLTEKLALLNDLGIDITQSMISLSPATATKGEATAVGILVGGAIGDALGLPFCGLSQANIQQQCGAIIVTSFQPIEGTTSSDLPL